MINRKMKIFRDTVHGYISVPEEYVSAFIDTDAFQRLRNIEQTGMRVLYPSARHDRFIHSLGTFYLGNKAINCLRNNLRSDYEDEKNDYYSVYDIDEDNNQFWDKCQMLFEISCLLHDCGHAPFSHTMEFLYDVKIEGKPTLTEKLASCFNSEFKTDIKKTKSAPHERMSALLVCTYYKSAISELLKKIFADTVLIDDSLEFISRAITGTKDGKGKYIKNLYGDLMFAYGIVNANNVEMVLEAFCDNEAQYYRPEYKNADTNELKCWTSNALKQYPYDVYLDRCATGGDALFYKVQRDGSYEPLNGVGDLKPLQKWLDDKYGISVKIPQIKEQYGI